jgi:hypothetical protein
MAANQPQSELVPIIGLVNLTTLQAFFRVEYRAMCLPMFRRNVVHKHCSQFPLFFLPRVAIHLTIGPIRAQCLTCQLDPATLRRPPNGAWYFDPPVVWVQGGVRGTHSKQFVFDTRPILAGLATCTAGRMRVSNSTNSSSIIMAIIHSNSKNTKFLSRSITNVIP